MASSSSAITPFPRTPSTTSVQSDRKASWTPQSRNPVSARLYKVLSTNFDDEETRQALQTLSDLYATPKGKEVRILAEDGDDDFVQTNVDTLVEDIPGESAARARKNLRRDMEKQVAEGSKKFLEALSEVDEVSLLFCLRNPCVSTDLQKLRDLQVHVAAMRASCDEAETQLTLTNESSKILLERAGNLRDER